MKRWIPIVAALLILLFAPELHAQAVPSPSTNVTTQQLTLAPQNPVPAPAAVTITSSIAGPATYDYWIVTHSGSEVSAPAGPYLASSAPSSLGGIYSNSIVWMPAVSGATYDLLRTATSAVPSGACACAVATGVASTSFTDGLASTTAYTVSTSPDQIAAVLNNTLLAPSPTPFVLGSSAYPCSMAAMQIAIAAAEAAGGGTVDARLCTSMTLTAETDIGDGTHSVALILPNTGLWNASTISDGSSCFLKVQGGSSIFSFGISNGGSKFLIENSGSVNAGAMICNVANTYSLIDFKGQLYNPNGGTYVNGLLYSVQPVDGSGVRDVTIANYSGIGLLVSQACCSASYQNIVTNGNGQTGAQPLVIQSGASATGAISFINLSADHPGAGKNAISISQTTGNVFTINFYNVYCEGNAGAAATAPYVDVSISNGSVMFDGLQVYSRNSSEAVYGLQIENNTGNVVVKNYGFFGTSTTRDILDDLRNSIAITSSVTSNTVEKYSTANPFSIDEIGQTALASGAGSKTFAIPFRVSPVVCSATDSTAAAAVKASATTTTLTLAGTSSDVINWDCKGN